MIDPEVTQFARRRLIETSIGGARTSQLIVAIVLWIGGRGGWAADGRSLVDLLGLIALVLAANLVGFLGFERRWSPTIHGAVGQALDIVAAVFFIQVFESGVGDIVWIAAMVPLISGGLRFGPAGTLVSWAAMSVTYMTVLVTSLMIDPTESMDLGAALWSLCFVLAISVPVGAVVYWLTQQWERQAIATMKIERQAAGITTVTRFAATSTMARLPAILQTAAGVAVDLGFAAATVTASRLGRETVLAASGQVDLARAGADDIVPNPTEVVATGWGDQDSEGTGPTAEWFSSSVALDDRGRFRLHGWSTNAPEDAQLETLHLLAVQARAAIERDEAVQSLRRQAARDPLTGLANRRIFERSMRRLSLSPEAVSLLYIDLDRFKAINDTHGHLAGDELLRIVARRIANRVPAASLPARIGGDEFAVVLPGVDDPRVALRVGQDIVEAMKEPIAIRAVQTQVSVSVGVAVSVGSGPAQILIRAADGALARAKSEGRGRCCLAHARHGRSISSSAPDPQSMSET